MAGMTETRTCLCGCGASLAGRDPRTRYATPACRMRGVRQRGGEGRVAAGAGPVDSPADLPDGSPADPNIPPWEQSRARKEAAQAELAELDLAVSRGELIEYARHRAVLAAAIIPRVNRVLGVPTRARESLPHLSIADIEHLDSLLRRALAGDGDEDDSLTPADLDVLEAFCREQRDELARAGGG